jgi:hypothetical protein
MRQMKKKKQSWYKIVFISISGLVLVVIGVVGWILPIIPGVPLIVIGIPMILTVHPPTARALRYKYVTIKRNYRMKKRMKKDRGKVLEQFFKVEVKTKDE